MLTLVYSFASPHALYWRISLVITLNEKCSRTYIPVDCFAVLSVWCLFLSSSFLSHSSICVIPQGDSTPGLSSAGTTWFVMLWILPPRWFEFVDRYSSPRWAIDMNLKLRSDLVSSKDPSDCSAIPECTFKLLLYAKPWLMERHRDGRYKGNRVTVGWCINKGRQTQRLDEWTGKA